MLSITRGIGREVRIATGTGAIEGTLTLPRGASGVVLLAQDPGSSRHNPRNRLVANAIADARIGTLLFDCLPGEEGTLAARLGQATLWLSEEAGMRGLRIGYFGAGTAAAAALVAAAKLGEQVDAVVSRGGRPDRASQYLPKVMAPTLLIVGSLDRDVVALNQHAYEQLRCSKALRIVPGEQVAELAVEWFRQWLAQDPEETLRSDEDEA